MIHYWLRFRFNDSFVASNFSRIDPSSKDSSEPDLPFDLEEDGDFEDDPTNG